jgi:hypothetical protein
MPKASSTQDGYLSKEDYNRITASTVAHNSTLLVQDAPNAVADQHYHLSSSQATEATQYATASLSGLLSASDWAVFNAKLDHAQVMKRVSLGF